MGSTTDKTKGAAARQALYNGLLVETQGQLGDAAKLTDTFAGGTARLEAQEQKLLVTVGEIITNNPALNNTTNARATSVTTNVCRSQLRLSVTLRAPSLSVAFRSSLTAASAGIKPKTNPVKTETLSVNAKTR